MPIVYHSQPERLYYGRGIDFNVTLWALVSGDKKYSDLVRLAWNGSGFYYTYNSPPPPESATCRRTWEIGDYSMATVDREFHHG